MNRQCDFIGTNCSSIQREKFGTKFSRHFWAILSQISRTHMSKRIFIDSKRTCSFLIEPQKTFDNFVTISTHDIAKKLYAKLFRPQWLHRMVLAINSSCNFNGKESIELIERQISEGSFVSINGAFQNLSFDVFCYEAVESSHLGCRFSFHRWYNSRLNAEYISLSLPFFYIVGIHF